MGLFLNRKLVKIDSFMNATSELCSSICDSDDPKFLDCSTCFAFCPEKCQSYFNYKLLSPPSHSHHKATPTTFLTVAIVLLAASFALVLAYTLYLRRRRRRINNIPITATATEANNPGDDNEQQGDFLDHGGATVEHHIWYIRTVGLDPAVISSITALKYKKGEGLVEGADCSVCLSEFQEDEALRLLPKCSHAFHVACIDTWLRSHTNCPMCRAPVFPGLVKPSSSSEDQSSGSNDSEETRIEILDGDVEESEVAENPNESLRVEPSRRSVSLDCLGAKELEVIRELRKVDSGKRVEKKLERLRSGGSSNNVQSVSSSTSAMKRSNSCHGKFVLCRPVRVTDSILPLRSV